VDTAPQAIHLPGTLYEALLRHAATTPVAEVCGLISRTGSGVLKRYPVTNRATDQTRAYAMDEKELIAAFRTMRTHNETLFAIYHSHPVTAAYPSVADQREANYPDAIYIIISLTDQPPIRGYEIGSTVREITIKRGQNIETRLRPHT
jgi:proteasome lid subunit RPN8/RPN11